MKHLIIAIFILTGICSNAQIGIGTTSPNSTLDVRGSLSIKYASFSANTTAGSSDNALVFTGTSAATLTLPDATACQGRVYWIKNTSSNSSTLTIATTSSQTIDGLASWSLTQTNKVFVVISNGANWLISSESLPGASAGTPWIYGGNNVTSQQNFGTTSNYHLPFITNNTEKMRLTSTGYLGIGTSTFNATYPEKLLVDAGATGNTNYQNVIVGKGNTNSYAQLNIQNSSAGTGASSDVVATANNGNETVNYIDMGINGGGNTSTGVLGGANTAYLYSTGNDFAIGNGTNSKNLNFFTTTSGTYTERMRIDANGNVGIGTSSPTAALHVVKSNSGGNVMTLQNTSASGYSSADFYSSTGTLSGTFGYGNASTGAPFTGRSYFNMYGNDFVFANGTNVPLFIETSNNNVGVGTSTFNATYPEKLLVDAGATGNTNYQNVIVGKGNTNSYAQLNIQNSSAGTGASSDVVATANNGNETVNYIDMGINGGGNTSTGVLGGANTAYLYSTGNDFAIGNGTNSKNLIFFTTTGGTYTERMRVNNTGLIPGADNTYSLGQSGTRWSAVWAANGTIQTSDRRLKTNIRNLRYGLREVMAMQPVSYDWKDNPGSNHKIGLIAQEVKNIVPEVVIGDEAKENLGMNYAELIPVLINAIKEQQKQIDDLNKKIKMLERK